MQDAEILLKMHTKGNTFLLEIQLTSEGVLTLKEITRGSRGRQRCAKG